MISSAYIDSELGQGVAETSIQQAEANRRLSIWLDNMEITQDQVLYLADPGATEWTKRCIRQADEILLFADAAASPGLTQLEQTVLSGEGRLSAARQTLVLLQPGGEALPVNTARWLSLRNVGFHVHIRADRQERDFGRLCRYLTDRMVGLVLAGGGAKGFAHAGVWRALEEAGIPVDFVGGTSMGSMVGGLLACDYDYKKVFAIIKEIATSPLKRDFNLIPVVSLFKGKILDRVLQKYYSDKDIEDCPLPFYCVSSNMTHAAPMVHRCGNMFHAIRASGSIPAVVPPVVDRQGLLIDGGIFNNFPTDIMIEMGAQFIIGVDFLVDQNKEIMFGEMPSSWKALRRRWFGGPQSKSTPTLLSTIIESTTLYSAFMQKQNSENTDIYINPDVNQFGMLDWAGYDKIVQKGYEEAKRVLDEYSEQLEKYIN